MFNQIGRLLICAATITMLCASGFQLFQNTKEIDSERALKKSSQAVLASSSVVFDYSHEQNSTPDFLHSLNLNVAVEKTADVAQLELNQKLVNGSNELVNNQATRYFVGTSENKQVILEKSEGTISKLEKATNNTVYEDINLPNQILEEYKNGDGVIRSKVLGNDIILSGVIKNPKIMDFETYSEYPKDKYFWKVEMNIDKKTYLPKNIKMERDSEKVNINYVSFSSPVNIDMPN